MSQRTSSVDTASRAREFAAPDTSELNRLEKLIHTKEEAIEESRWAQAKEVVRLRDELKLPQRVIAEGWINVRTRKAYSQQHVRTCEFVWRRFGESSIRPRWSDAYYTVQANSKEVLPASDAWRGRDQRGRSQPRTRTAGRRGAVERMQQTRTSVEADEEPMRDPVICRRTIVIRADLTQNEAEDNYDRVAKAIEKAGPMIQRAIAKGPLKGKTITVEFF